MAHPSSGWKRTVGPQWSSVKRQGDSSGPPPGMQQGVHSSYLIALSSPDTTIECQRQLLYQQQQLQQLQLQQQLQEQQQQQQQELQQQQHLLLQQQQQQEQLLQQQQLRSTNDTLLSSGISQPGASFDTAPPSDSFAEHQRASLQQQENQRQQELYLQQLQLMQRLQAMPGSTTRPWYPTFGPAIITSCSDSTIQLDNPNQYTLINNAKLNRHAVGPHWRSIQTSTSYSPTSSPPSSSPQMQARTIAAPSSSSCPTPATSSTTAALHAYLSSTYSSAASIDHARATSFHNHHQDMETLSDNKEPQPRSVHQQYYESHSYPHDPRHYSLHSQPGNSREARETLPLTNGVSSSMTVTRVTQTTPGTKRKAACQDVKELDEDNSQSTRPTSTHRYQPATFSGSTAPSSQNPIHSAAVQSAIQQFMPLSITTNLQARSEQDQEMGNTEANSSIAFTSSASSRMSMDMLSMDQEDMDISASDDAAESRASLRHTKRTRPRLDPSVFGITSVVEARRLQSGEQMHDVIQECFYNAAASSR